MSQILLWMLIGVFGLAAASVGAYFYSAKWIEIIYTRDKEDLDYILDTQGEFVTPTGAAICAAVRTRSCLPDRMRIRKTGYGAGKRTYAIPSLLRVMLLEETPAEETCVPETGAITEDGIWKLESNLDDCSGEVLGYVSGCLFRAGARDVYYTPIFMKKGRPAWQIGVLCTEDRIPEMERILFRETTTIGIRRMPVTRTILKRRAETVETPYGAVDMKICEWEGRDKACPEYESVAALAERTGQPFMEIWHAARNRYRTEDGNSKGENA